MKVICIARRGETLPEEYLDSRLPRTRETDFHLTVGKEYVVYAIGVSAEQVWYYVVDDDNLWFPIRKPAPLFKVVDDRVSHHWRVKLTPGNLTTACCWPLRSGFRKSGSMIVYLTKNRPKSGCSRNGSSRWTRSPPVGGRQIDGWNGFGCRMLRFLKRADFDFSVCMKSQAMWFLRQSFAVILSSTLAFPLWATNYDANGNTTASNGMGYAVVNHRDSGARLNHMILEVVHGVTTKYLVDTQNPTGYAQVVQESMSGSTSANRELSRAFVYGLERISQLRSYLANGQSQTQTSYYVYDGHGSVRALADPNGNVTDTYDYDAFGNLIHSTGTTPNTTLFAGEQYDPDLNLYYNRARYLNVSTGRFWSMDTEEGDPQSPLSLHKYLYSSNDPTNRRDPSGHFDIGEA